MRGYFGSGCCGGVLPAWAGSAGGFSRLGFAPSTGAKSALRKPVPSPAQASRNQNAWALPTSVSHTKAPTAATGITGMTQSVAFHQGLLV